MGKRLVALLACIVLSLVGCGKSGEVRNDPNLDAQQILDKALEHTDSDEVIGTQDQVIDLAAKVKMSTDVGAGGLDMSMVIQQSGDQQMMGMDMTMKANFGGRSSQGGAWLMFERDGAAYNVYARRELPTKSSPRTQSPEYGRDSLSEAELEELMSNSVSTSLEISDYLVDVEKLGAYEEGDAYLIEAVPSAQTVKRIMAKNSSGTDLGDASVENAFMRLTVDKESCRPRQFAMDLKVKFSAGEQKGTMEFNVDLTIKDDDVTLSVPAEAANAREVDLEKFISN